MKQFLHTIGFALAVGLWVSSIAFGQGVDPAQFAEAQKQNGAALHTYSHKERVDLQLKGESKKVTLNLVRYDLSGAEEKTLLSEEPKEQQEEPDLPGRDRRGARVKDKVIENKKEDFKEMMQGLAGLVKSYTQIPPDKLKAAMAQAEKSAGQGDLQGSVGLKLSNVVQDKDTLTIWIDPATLMFRRIEIGSSYDSKPVTVTVGYSTLPSGPTYMAEANLQYPEKNLVLRIENFDYATNQ